MTTVFFDVDTQLDFLYPAGGLYVPGAESIVPNVARLNQYAGSHGIRLISDMDAHRENDEEFLHWPPHCIAGTLGQRKPAETLLSSRAVIPSRKGHDAVPDARQIILEKQSLDCFTNPNLPGLLEGLKADRYVVYGVVTEICVKFAAFGLLRTGRRVELVTDAVRSLSGEAARTMMEEFTAAGGGLRTTAQILE
ncbi:MAG TPA: isochorismatase family cysteine hydrolase [Bryobacteraceae bacterium]|nr:isochorismatase family cysteine hydrolase [Bryobacteraceae bacterium]